jgi:hypothetical protein
MADEVQKQINQMKRDAGYQSVQPIVIYDKPRALLDPTVHAHTERKIREALSGAMAREEALKAVSPGRYNTASGEWAPGAQWHTTTPGYRHSKTPREFRQTKRKAVQREKQADKKQRRADKLQHQVAQLKAEQHEPRE